MRDRSSWCSSACRPGTICLSPGQRMSRDRAGLRLPFPSGDSFLCHPLSHMKNSYQCHLAGDRDLIQAFIQYEYCWSAADTCLFHSSWVLYVPSDGWVRYSWYLPAVTQLDIDISLSILHHSFYFCRFFISTQFVNLMNNAIPQTVALAQLKVEEHRVDTQAEISTNFCSQVCHERERSAKTGLILVSSTEQLGIFHIFECCSQISLLYHSFPLFCLLYLLLQSKKLKTKTCKN